MSILSSSAFMSIPLSALFSNADQISTYVQAELSNVADSISTFVHLSGNEVISGDISIMQKLSVSQLSNVYVGDNALSTLIDTQISDFTVPHLTDDGPTAIKDMKLVKFTAQYENLTSEGVFDFWVISAN